MHNHNTGELIAIFAINIGAYSLTSINAGMGAVSLVLTISYTAVKLYNEIKKNKQLKQNDNGNFNRPTEE